MVWTFLSTVQVNCKINYLTNLFLVRLCFYVNVVKIYIVLLYKQHKSFCSLMTDLLGIKANKIENKYVHIIWRGVVVRHIPY